MEKAFLVAHDRETVYFAEASGFGPHSAVTDLIQGIYAIDPEMSRRLLRNRIYSSAPLTPMCLGMVKVAAKRITQCSAAEIEEKLKPLASFVRTRVSPSEMPPAAFGLDLSGKIIGEGAASGEVRAVLEGLFSSADKSPLQYLRDRRVSALLVSTTGDCLAWAVNTNAIDRTRHAEVNLVQGYFSAGGGMPPPRDARLYVSLKPCRMCAGMIHQWAESSGTGLRVFFLDEDLGPAARDTALDQGSAFVVQSRLL